MPGIAVFLTIPAILWGAVLAFRLPLIGGCVAAIVAMCCLNGDLWSVEAAGLDWSIDRFLVIGLSFAFLAQWWIGKTDPKPISRNEWLLALFFGLLVVSTFTHDWKATAVDDQGSILMHLVNGYLIPIVIFWIARNSRLDERQLRWSLAILACFGMYLAVTAILEVGGNWSLVVPRYIADPTKGIHFGRARGPMLQSARLGLYLVTCGTITAFLLSHRRGFRRWGIALAALVMPVYLAAIYFTYTRSVWMGTALVVVVVAGLTLRGRARVLALAAMLIALSGVIAVKGDKLIAFKREYTATDTRKSTQMRASFAYVSWQMFKEQPLVGRGFGQFPHESKDYLGDRSTALQLEQIRGFIHHNTFLSLLVELGVFGLLLFLAILWSWLRGGWSLYRARENPAWVRCQGLLMLCAFSPYVFQLMFREVSYSPVENSLIFFFAGITVSLRAKFMSAPARRRVDATTDRPRAFATMASGPPV